MRKILFVLMSLLLVPAGMAYAVPDLGVFSGTGYYAGVDENPSQDDFIVELASNGYVAPSGGYHGFVVGPSSSTLTVFVKAKYWAPDMQDAKKIYLLASVDDANAPLYFGGAPLTLMDFDGFKSFNEPYYGRELLSNEGWLQRPLENTEFYTLTGDINYESSLSLGNFFFAAADLNGDGSIGQNEVSPMTTSAAGGFDTPGNPVPEPGSLLLLGMGLAGILSYKLKTKKS